MQHRRRKASHDIIMEDNNQRNIHSHLPVLTQRCVLMPGVPNTYYAMPAWKWIWLHTETIGCIKPITDDGDACARCILRSPPINSNWSSCVQSIKLGEWWFEGWNACCMRYHLQPIKTIDEPELAWPILQIIAKCDAYTKRSMLFIVLIVSFSCTRSHASCENESAVHVDSAKHTSLRLFDARRHT